jgi:hypothetical protein
LRTGRAAGCDDGAADASEIIRNRIEAAQDAGTSSDARFIKLKKQPKTVEALVSMFVSACFSDAPLAPLHTRTARGE